MPLSIVPSHLDSSNVQLLKLLEDSGGEVDTISRTARALVLDSRSDGLALVVDVDRLFAAGAVIGVRAVSILRDRQSHNVIARAVVLATRADSGRVVRSL